MKVLLIDGDRLVNGRHLFPNLALMKLSAWHRKRGDSVQLNWFFDRNVDQAYLSMVFPAKHIWKLLPFDQDSICYGGSGFEKWNWLPDEVEHIYPDYSLYNCDYALGFTSRGCPRRCAFCIVPEKEGLWRATADICEFWNGQSKLRLLDNNLTANEEYCLRILNEFIEHRIQVDFNQGLDIRFLTDKIAQLLARVKLWKQIHFAWDRMQDEGQVRKGITILDRAMPLSRVMFYVLIGFDTTPEEDLYRVETLRGLKVDPFVMPYGKTKYEKRFTRWVNHKAIFKSVQWKDYK